MQLSSSAADVTDVSSRELSCKSGSSGVEGLPWTPGGLAGSSRGRLGRQEACPEQEDRRRDRLWRQERQEARLEAVLGARRPV